MKRRWCLALCAALSASSCKEATDDDDEEAAPKQRVDAEGHVVLTAEEQKALGLEIAAAEQGSLTTRALRFGKVIARPREDALVAAPVTGRLVTPTLALGARVAAGDVLLILEPVIDTTSRATLEAQRRELQGQIEGARAQVAAKKSDLTRVKTLVISGLATAAESAQAEAALTTEEARVESLGHASAELGRVTGGRIELRAPAAGVVAMLATEAGSLIQQGSIVGRIVQAGPRWIDIAVPPEDPIGTGYRVKTAPAKLLARGAVVQTDGTRRDRLEVEQDVAAHLLPGAVVAVEVLHETPGILIPASAIVRRGPDTLVFVAVKDGLYEARRVEVSARDETGGVVTSGLAAGDRVVSRGAASLLGEIGDSAK